MPFATYRLGDLPLESGEILRDAQITYAPHGQLAPDRRNVVLCPTFFGGDHTGYDWLIGSGRPLDTDRYRVVVPGLFGNGFSSSPSDHLGTRERGDVGATRGYGGSVRTALEAVRADTVSLPGPRDQCFAPQDEAATARIVPCSALSAIPGVWGHPAGSGATATDRDFVATALSRLLERVPAAAGRS